MDIKKTLSRYAINFCEYNRKVSVYRQIIIISNNLKYHVHVYAEWTLWCLIKIINVSDLKIKPASNICHQVSRNA